MGTAIDLSGGPRHFASPTAPSRDYERVRILMAKYPHAFSIIDVERSIDSMKDTETIKVVLVAELSSMLMDERSEDFRPKVADPVAMKPATKLPDSDKEDDEDLLDSYGPLSAEDEEDDE